MRSYHLDPGRGADGLSVRDEAKPAPGRAQVVVRMRAHSVGARDLLVLAGDYPLAVRPDVVPGCEGVGEVVAVGEDVTRVAPGDRVAATVFPRWLDGPFRRADAAQLGTTVDGVLTEYALAGEDAVVPVPDHLSFEEAAALPLAAVTAWNALTTGSPLRPGATVLTLGSGAVSLFVLQFAKLAGARHRHHLQPRQGGTSPGARGGRGDRLPPAAPCGGRRSGTSPTAAASTGSSTRVVHWSSP
jgi:NADPH:quinone reductase-like Zn-dependent oxidoreductase